LAEVVAAAVPLVCDGSDDDVELADGICTFSLVYSTLIPVTFLHTDGREPENAPETNLTAAHY